MPHLQFKLSNARAHFHITSESEQWQLRLDGEITPRFEYSSFEVFTKNETLDGLLLKAEVIVDTLPRTERKHESDKAEYGKPGSISLIYYKPDDPHDNQSSAWFEIYLQLSTDELHRLREISTHTHQIYLLVETPLFDATGSTDIAFTYGDDPNGKDIVWRLEKGNSSQVEKFSFTISSIDKKVPDLLLNEEAQAEPTPAVPQPAVIQIDRGSVTGRLCNALLKRLIH